MKDNRDLVEAWCEDHYGLVPTAVSMWAEDDDLINALIRLPNSVIGLAIEIDEEGQAESEEFLEIQLNDWTPGSVQARQLSDGRVRLFHRRKEVIFAARIRGPEWASALLEEWLMEMRGDLARPRDKSRRFSEMKRTRDLISRLLDQAELENVQRDKDRVAHRLESATEKLQS